MYWRRSASVAACAPHTPGLEQQHPDAGVLRQPGRHHAASSARAHHDVVELGLPTGAPNRATRLERAHPVKSRAWGKTLRRWLYYGQTRSAGDLPAEGFQRGDEDLGERGERLDGVA